MDTFNTSVSKSYENQDNLITLETMRNICISISPCDCYIISGMKSPKEFICYWCVKLKTIHICILLNLSCVCCKLFLNDFTWHKKQNKQPHPLPAHFIHEINNCFKYWSQTPLFYLLVPMSRFAMNWRSPWSSERTEYLIINIKRFIKAPQSVMVISW